MEQPRDIRVGQTPADIVLKVVSKPTQEDRNVVAQVGAIATLMDASNDQPAGLFSGLAASPEAETFSRHDQTRTAILRFKSPRMRQSGTFYYKILGSTPEGYFLFGIDTDSFVVSP